MTSTKAKKWHEFSKNEHKKIIDWIERNVDILVIEGSGVKSRMELHIINATVENFFDEEADYPTYKAKEKSLDEEKTQTRIAYNCRGCEEIFFASESIIGYHLKRKNRIDATFSEEDLWYHILDKHIQEIL